MRKRLVLSEKPMAMNQARGFYIQLCHRVPKPRCSRLGRQQLPGGRRCSFGFTVQEQQETRLVAPEHWDAAAALAFQKERTEELPAHPGGHPKLADTSETQILMF